MITNPTAKAFSTSTSPVSASLTATFRAASMRYAARPDEPARNARGLDLAALYPDLYAADQAAPPSKALKASISFVRELGAAFRNVPVPH